MTRHARLGLLVAALVIAADQASKWWMLTLVMQPPHRIPALPFLDLVHAWNRGISFGLFNQGSIVWSWLLSGLAIAIAGALLVWLRKAEKAGIAVNLGAIIGGALGNVADRVQHGAVYDFLYFHVGSFDWWPAFNLADSAISLGAVYLIGDSLFARDKMGPKMEGS